MNFEIEDIKGKSSENKEESISMLQENSDENSFKDTGVKVYVNSNSKAEIVMSDSKRKRKKSKASIDISEIANSFIQNHQKTQKNQVPEFIQKFKQ